MNRAKRREMFERWRAANPHPQTELHWRNPFELLIAVILSAQATDKSVNLGTQGLFKEAPDPASMLKLGEAGLIKHIKHIGLYQSKAKHVLQTCAMLIERHGGEVPRAREALEALAGVGRKTANVVLNTAFGEPTMAVDTHIFRVANRTGLAPGKDVLAVEMKLLRFIEPEFLRDAHHWLILHGRYVCKARKPDCPGLMNPIEPLNRLFIPTQAMRTPFCTCRCILRLRNKSARISHRGFAKPGRPSSAGNRAIAIRRPIGPWNVWGLCFGRRKGTSASPIATLILIV
ncbi:MAG: endonuclease III [Betaproteobacteria bacterium]|nr:endonuclease III [Betaproteobacteria bacterium]